MVYNKNNWKADVLLDYFNKRKDLEYINPKIKDILIEVYTLVGKDGINKTINKKNLKEIYYKHVKE